MVPRKLYIVTTGYPGPEPSACGFVELEDQHGAGHGPDVGVGWDRHPNSDTLARLGPFMPALSETVLATATAAGTLRLKSLVNRALESEERFTEDDMARAVVEAALRAAGLVE